jgi:hypothetical protein
MCAIAVMPSSFWMRITSSAVFERFSPRAWLVTETKAGSSCFSSSIVR